jgi:glycosyltransferase involved in cell wall biosynthesis
MKLGIVTRKDEKEKWGGDLKALYGIYEGLKEIGQDVVLVKTAEELKDADFVFLSNSVLDLREDFAAVKKSGRPFGVFCMHEDRVKYYGLCYGFAYYVGLCLHQIASLDKLFQYPEVAQYFSRAIPEHTPGNISIMQHADVCIATSPMEKEALQRDCPGCKTEVVYLDCGIPTVGPADDSFLQWTGLKRGEYALQVGRLELRKNQLATVLAMKDLDIPLVFIATKETNISYEKMVVDAIKKWRKAPTLMITQTSENERQGNLQILRMPEQKILPRSMLISAYQNAGLLVHPAFCELPGLIYLEAAKLGVPIIASNWATIGDYFTDPMTGKYTLDDRIAYVEPHHVKDLEALILKQFGKKIDRQFAHPIFQRTRSDVANDLLKAMRISC